MGESADITARDAQTAARLNADVGVQHIAGVYAKALLGAAGDMAQAAALLDELDALMSEVFARFPKLEAILVSALVSHDEKVGVLDRVLGSQVSPRLRSFLKVVSRHGRLDCLRAIHRQARTLYEQMQGRVRVQLITAMPVDGAAVSRIAVRLRTMLGGEPILEQVVDPALIGGAMLRVGDTIYDGSIARQLQTIRQQMIDRSVHEIQDRRDRFRSPAGN